MPDTLWKFFQQNRRLLKDLPALGAAVVQEWAKREHQACVLVMVVRHTFGRHLTFNPHLHMLVSSGGFNESKAVWIDDLKFDQDSLMQRWRFAVVTYIRVAFEAGLLRTEKTASQVDVLLYVDEERWWSTSIKKFACFEHFLRYAGRYIRRPPIAQYRFKEVSSALIRFRTNDLKQKREVETQYGPAEFVSHLAEHVPEHYAHAVRYFGLLSPRSKGRLFAGMFAVLGQTPRPHPQRLSWALSIKREFGVDPLMDSRGERMRWYGRIGSKAHIA